MPVIGIHASAGTGPNVRSQTEAVAHGSLIGTQENVIASFPKVQGSQARRSLETSGRQNDHLCSHVVINGWRIWNISTNDSTLDPGSGYACVFLDQLDHRCIGPDSGVGLACFDAMAMKIMEAFDLNRKPDAWLY